MMKALFKLKLFVSMLLLCYCASGQVILQGTVKDNRGEPLSGVSISVDEKTGTVTDTKGHYSINTDRGNHILIFRYIGFAEQRKEIGAETNTTVDIILTESTSGLDQVVISAGRYEQEVKRVTVSTDIIKPYLVQNKVTVNMENIMNQLPSVNVVDGQVNIRGGSGWTYGAGSRVLVMLDDMPYQSGDAGQVQWKFLPVENLEQIEVIKGASSVLYGSSALNGTINIRTASPTSTPKSTVTVFSGVYDQLPRESSRWSDRTRFQYGFNSWHSRKARQLDLTIGLNYLKDEGYRLGEDDHRLRLNVKTNYHHKKIPGLSYGINGTASIQKSASFLLWESYTFGYTALDSVKTITNATNISVDPHLDLYARGFKHRIRTRYTRTVNDNETSDTVDQDNSFHYVYGEYQLQRLFFRNIFTATGGVAASHVESRSPLYTGSNSSTNYAPFAQLDIRYKRITLSAGIRHEIFKINAEQASQTISRFGANYELTRSTFLRASYGEGYRFPTIAEKYILTSVGQLNIFPNPQLRPETGWNLEAGIKQGFKVSGWEAYGDVAWFLTEYQDMIEFNFGQWKRTAAISPANFFTSYGFKAINTGDTRITGLDVTLAGRGKIGVIETKLLGGYTYTQPVSLQPDQIFITDSGSNPLSYRSTSENPAGNRLKYRYSHLFKTDVELGYKAFTLGFSVRYNSYMENTDRVFTSAIFEIASPGIPQARMLNKNGDWIFDARFGVKATKYLSVNLVVNNITNHEQMTRPADLRPPRMFILQASCTF